MCKIYGLLSLNYINFQVSSVDVPLLPVGAGGGDAPHAEDRGRLDAAGLPGAGQSAGGLLPRHELHGQVPRRLQVGPSCTACHGQISLAVRSSLDKEKCLV